MSSPSDTRQDLVAGHGATDLRRMAISIALLLWALFAVVLYEVLVHGRLTVIDAPAIAWAATHRSGPWTEAAEWISSTGGPSMTSAYTAILILIALARRRFATAMGVAFVVYGAVAFNVIVKDSVKRGRPVMEDPLVHLITYSFPSGHAAASTVFGGILLMLLVAQRTGELARVLGITAIVSWIAAVCATRVYLGAHYPTDVLAGVLEGTGWLLLCRIVLHRHDVSLARRPRAG